MFFWASTGWSRNRIISHFPHAEHRVGEDVGFGVGELISLFTQLACHPRGILEICSAYTSDFLFTDKFSISWNNSPTLFQRLFFTYRKFTS